MAWSDEWILDREGEKTMPDEFPGLERYFAQSDEFTMAMRRATEAMDRLRTRAWDMGNAVYIGYADIPGRHWINEKKPCPMVCDTLAVTGGTTNKETT